MTQSRRLAARWVLTAMLERGVAADPWKWLERLEPRRTELLLSVRQLRLLRVSPCPVVWLSLFRHSPRSSEGW